MRSYALAARPVRWIGLGVSFALAVTVGNLGDAMPASASAPLAVTAADAPVKVEGRPDRVSAFLAAAAQESRVEITGERTASSTTWANPDGTLTTDESTEPVRVRRGGDWVPVDMHLVQVSGGWAPTASPSGVVFSAGGDGPAVKLAEGAKKVWLNWTTTLPAPTVEGARATYALDVDTDGADRAAGGFRAVPGFEEGPFERT